MLLSDEAGYVYKLLNAILHTVPEREVENPQLPTRSLKKKQTLSFGKELTEERMDRGMVSSLPRVSWGILARRRKGAECV